MKNLFSVILCLIFCGGSLIAKETKTEESKKKDSKESSSTDDVFDPYMVRALTVAKSIGSLLHVLPKTSEREGIDLNATTLAVAGVSLAHQARLEGKEIPEESMDALLILDAMYVNLTYGIPDAATEPDKDTKEQKKLIEERLKMLAKHLVVPTDKMEIKEWIAKNKEGIKRLHYHLEENGDDVKITEDPLQSLQ